MLFRSGYFNMCYMNPDGTGIDSPNGYYNRDHEIIANIRPIAEGEEEEVEIPKMLTAYNMILCTGTTYKKEEDNSIKINMERVLNNSDHSNTIRYTFGMIVFDKDNQIIAYRKNTSSFSGFSYRTNIDFYFGTKSLSYDSKTDTYLPNGEYTMIPVLFNDEYLSEYTMEDVIPMDVNGGISRFDITVTDRKSVG